MNEPTMNEKVMNKVIGDYAIENANLRLQIAGLNAEIEELQKQKEEEKGEVK